MAGIFLNYRSVDDAYAAAAISTSLVEHFGRECVFRDCDSMIPGTVYPAEIRSALERCVLLISVIGPRWLNADDGAGHRRIDNHRDWVRMELRRAFERGIPVVPVLLDGADLPSPGELPGDIRNLALSQSWMIRHRSLDSDVRQLAERITRTVAPVRGNETRPDTNSATWTQYNQPANGATLFAAQGTQNINMPTGDNI